MARHEMEASGSLISRLPILQLFPRKQHLFLKSNPEYMRISELTWRNYTIDYKLKKQEII